MAELLTFN